MAGMKTFLSSTESLVRLGFLIALGLVLLSELKHNTNVTTTANTTIGQVVTGISQFGGWIGLVVLIVVGAYFFKAMKFGNK